MGCVGSARKPISEILRVHNQMVTDILDYTEKAKTNPEYISNDDTANQTFIQEMNKVIERIKVLHKPDEFSGLTGARLIVRLDLARMSILNITSTKVLHYDIGIDKDYELEDYMRATWYGAKALQELRSQYTHNKLRKKYIENTDKLCRRAYKAIFDITEKNRDLFPSPYDF